MYNAHMLNDNRRYDLKDFKKNEHPGSYKASLNLLRGLFLTLSSTAVVLAIVLTGAFIAKRHASDTVITNESSGIAVLEGPVATPVPENVYTVTEYYQDSDVVNSYFGELEPAANPVLYEHVPVRGIYIGGAAYLDENIELIHNSELNAVVIDLKESNGVYFNSSNEVAISSGSVMSNYNLQEVVQRCHDEGIWVIGRIVCFNDPILAQADPSRAICDSAGNVLYFSTEGSHAFLNPYDTNNWEYLIDMAYEAIDAGVDEIQFDYIRFPTGSTTSGNAPYFGVEGQIPEKYEVVNRFIRYARTRIQDTLGIPISCDLFGIIVLSDYDGYNIGQNWQTVGLCGEDSICPMIYPSHYALGTMFGQVTYDKPDLYPYDVMLASIYHGEDAFYQTGYCTVRPYVQAFTAAYIGAGNYQEYGYEQINDQIRAIQDAGLEEYILWNAGAVYPEGNYGGNNG